MIKELSLSIPLLEAIEQVPGYAKFIKELVTKKRVVNFKDIGRLHHFSVNTSRYLVEKKKDLGAFMIPCAIRTFNFKWVLYDLGVSINLIPLVVYK